MAEERSLKAMAGPLLAWGVLAAASIAALCFAIRHAPVAPFWPDEWMQTPVATGQRPFSPGWLLAFHNEHRIPLPKLLWVGVMRMTNFDARWGAALNVALLTAAASIVLLAVRRFRGRTLWTDAFIPLLFLHWGHWENLTWPFQVCWALQTLLLAILIRATLRPEPVAFNVALPLLPLCGAATLPFVGLMATWRLFRLWKETPRRFGPMILPLVGLLIIPAYFIGVRKPPQYPPNPGPMSTLTAALECLAGSLGPVGWWPWIGAWALGLFGLANVLLVRGALRNAALRVTAEGLILFLGALAALALLIGQSRAGVHPLVGFTSRYALLFSFFPLIAYIAADFGAPPKLAKGLRGQLLAILAIAGVVHGLYASTHLEMRDVAGTHLLRDVRAGMSPRLVVHRNPFWSPEFEPEMEEGMQALVDSKRWMYRTLPPPVAGHPDAAGNLITPLRDGRTAFELRRDARIRIPLQAGLADLRLDIGHLRSSTGKLAVQCFLVQGSNTLAMVYAGELRRAPGIETRVEKRVDLPPGSELEITLMPDGPRDTPPRDVELAVIVTFTPVKPGP